MSEKNFLDQFSDSNKKPDSFKEEERIPVSKKQFNYKPVIIGFIVLVVLLAIILFLIFRPKISVQNFVGSKRSDVVDWLRQQEIETNGIVFKEEYSLDYDEGIVMSQSVEEGKKVTKKAVMTFEVSLGADPDELIELPDLYQMNKADVEKWISDNKLSKTKVSSAYDDEIAEGEVISYTLTGVEEDKFCRSSNLKIIVSKGVQPLGTVTVEDFTNRSYSEFESWAKNKKVNLSKAYRYSDTVALDCVVSQSVEGGKTIKEGETITVYVSKGKAIVLADLSGNSENEATVWCSGNGLSALSYYQYSAKKKGTVISQSPAASSVLQSGDTVKLYISLGQPDPGDIDTLDALKEWISKVNDEGANLKLNKLTYELNEKVDAGKIISISSTDCNSKVDVVVSKGKNIYIENWPDVSDYDEDTIRQLCEDIGANYHIEYQYSETVDCSMVISVKRSDDKELKSGSYIPESEEIIIVICDK